MKKFSLVYIDDNLLNLEMFVDIFEDDFDISTLSNPLNALSTVKELKPDMVILDVHMPFKNGIQLFRE
ncbi:response regulator, partial [Bacteriovorax sp. DB6_IX]